MSPADGVFPFEPDDWAAFVARVVQDIRSEFGVDTATRVAEALQRHSAELTRPTVDLREDTIDLREPAPRAIGERSAPGWGSRARRQG